MPPRKDISKEEIREKMYQVKTHKGLSNILNCGTDLLRKLLLEYDLYEEFCLITGRKPKTELLVCCICGSTNRVEKRKGKPYCKKHINHIVRYGKIIEKTIYDKNDYEFIDDVVKIILRDKYQNIKDICIIDREDYNKVKDYKWYSIHGYCKTKGINKNNAISIHNVIMNNLYNIDIIIYDHEDRNKMNNRKNNLRIVNDQQNSMNMSMKNTNTSGVTGVQIYTKDLDLKWTAFITYKYKNIYLGRFLNFDDAVLCRLEGEAKYFKTYSPNYNKESNTICLNYISQEDGKEKYLELDLNGRLIQEELLIKC